jgi:hypothetical protein
MRHHKVLFSVLFGLNEELDISSANVLKIQQQEREKLQSYDSLFGATPTRPRLSRGGARGLNQNGEEN